MSFKNKFDFNKKINQKKITIEQEIINIFTYLQQVINSKELNKNTKIRKYIIDKNSLKKMNIKEMINIAKEIIKIIITKLFELYQEKSQLRNYIIKLENDIRKNMKQILENNYLKEIYLDKIHNYIRINEDFEQLKEKVKFNEGKFLNNDKKDNEIFILKRENSNLKNEIEKLEKKIKEKIINKAYGIRKKKKDYNIQYNSLNNKHINIRIIDSPEKSMNLSIPRSNNNNQIINNNIIINSYNKKYTSLNKKNKSKEKSYKNILNMSQSNKRMFKKNELKKNDMNKTMNIFYKGKVKNRVFKNI